MDVTSMILVVKCTPFFFSLFYQNIYSHLQDFYLDLVEDNRRITPRDYLELALQPVQGGGKDIASKNEVILTMDLIGGVTESDVYTLEA